MKSRFLSLAAVLGALGTGFCCLGPVIFSALGVSAMASLTMLSYVVPYRNIFLAVTVITLALAVTNVVVRRGRASWAEWAVMGGSTAVVTGLFAYTVMIEGWPRLW